MRIWHLSDTHENEHMVNVPSNIDIAIFSGDEANDRNQYNNEPKSRKFFDWFSNLDIKYKIFVAGNHSSAIFHKLITKDEIEKMGIIYLENDFVEIEGFKIWGSPYSTSFGNWVFQKNRHKIHKIWDEIPEDTDILITHSPPKGMLDLTYDRGGALLQVGCNNLRKRVFKVKPKLHLFGHIHDNEGLLNAGTLKLETLPETIFSNGACVTDFKYGKVTSHGNVFIL